MEKKKFEKVNKDEFTREVLRAVTEMDYIKTSDVPNIELYMDQVTTFMDRYLESSKRYDDDKLLTKTMINNYTKNNLIPSPDKKKYSSNHVFLLLLIYYMKNIMSISDIRTLLKPVTEYTFNEERDYDMSDVYDEIFNIAEQQSKDMVKDLLRKIKISETAFGDMVQNDEEKEYFRMFGFICMLCFDVYTKTQVIESLLDNSDIFRKEKEEAREEAEKTKTKAKAKKED